MNYKGFSNKNLCVSIANKSFEKCVDIASKADLVELRLDLLDLNFTDLENLFKQKAKFIITNRLGDFMTEQSASFLKNIIDLGADFVDIEIEKKNEYVDDLIKYAKSNHCKVILSYHNFEHTPQKDDLQNIIDFAKEKKPDFIKIATDVKTQKDVLRILSLYENNDKLIAFGMGEVGRISRVSCLYMGSPFTYVSADKENKTASGQFTVEDMNLIFSLI